MLFNNNNHQNEIDLERYSPCYFEAGSLRQKAIRRFMGLKLKDVVEILEAEVCTEVDDWGDIPISSGCGSDLMSDVLAFIKPNCLLLTGLINSQVIRTAEIADIRAICFVRGKKPDIELMNLARSSNIPLFATRLAMFESCGKLYEKGLLGVTQER